MMFFWRGRQEKSKHSLSLTVDLRKSETRQKSRGCSRTEILFQFVCLVWFLILAKTFFSFQGENDVRDTTITSLIYINATTMAPTPHRKSPWSVDVLIIGSKNNMEHIQAQRETWASHHAIRHFFVSTEDDGNDPLCENIQDRDFKSYWTALHDHYAQCHGGHFWEDTMGGTNQLTTVFSEQYFGLDELSKYPSPLGWVCAQRRFMTSLTTLIDIYGNEGNNYTIPDYFILADDDTYVNVDHIVELMMIKPTAQKKRGIPPEMMPIPPPEDLAVSASYRFEFARETMKLPWGGYGMFFSKGALEKMLRPLHCRTRSAYDEDGLSRDGSSLADEGNCEKLLNKEKYGFPMNQTIGEEHYFELGDSLNQVFYKYFREVKHVCVHSDWVIGYLANFHNVSERTRPGLQNSYGNEFRDDPSNRLFGLPGRNRPVVGVCRHTDTACHRMKKDKLHELHNAAKKLFKHDL